MSMTVLGCARAKNSARAEVRRDIFVSRRINATRRQQHRGPLGALRAAPPLSRPGCCFDQVASYTPHMLAPAAATRPRATTTYILCARLPHIIK